MISVTSDMILGSVLFSLALGALAGVLHSLVHLVSGLLRTVLRRAVGDKLQLPLGGSLAGEIFDFILTLSVGISYILILYAHTDGVFYPTSLLALIVGFLVFRAVPRSLIGRRRR